MRALQGVTAFLLVCSVLQADPGRCEWQTFNENQGLEFPRCMAIDSTGAYWFGAWGSVLKYDGMHWQTYTEADGLTLGGPGDVWTMLVDHLGNLWLAVRNKGVGYTITRFDGTRSTHYGSAHGLAGDWVFAMLEDHRGRLWVGTGAGVSCYDGVTWKTYTSADGHSIDGSVMTEDAGGRIWVRGGGGVIRYDGVHWETFTVAGGVTAILADRAGGLWVTTSSGGVVHYDGVVWRTLAPDGSLNNRVNSILEDRTGCLWFGTDGGVFRYDGAGWAVLTEADGLASDLVWQIVEDAVGNLWFVTAEGVSRYDKTDWRDSSTVSGGSLERFLLQDSQRRLWFGTSAGSVVRYDGFTSWQKITESPVKTIVEGPPDVFWFETPNGASRLAGGQWETYTTADGLVSDSVNVILVDSAGTTWFATPHGVSRFDGIRWETYTVADGLAGNDVSFLLEDRTGSIWAASDCAVNRFDGSRWLAYTIDDGFGCDGLYGMTVDGFGNLWVPLWSAGSAERHYGLSRYDGTRWTRYFPEGEEIVRSMLVDRSGKLWVGLNRDVACFDGSTWTRYLGLYHGEGDMWATAMYQDRVGNMWFGMHYGYGVARFNGSTWRFYGPEEGLAVYSVSWVAEDYRGVIWFGTVIRDPIRKSISLFEPDQVPPRTFIIQGPPALSPAREAGFSFVAAFGEAKVEFSQALDGGPWSPWSPANSCSYSGVPDGDHVVTVRARDWDGNVQRPGVVWSFGVDATPPTPSIASPVYGAAIRDTVDVMGSATDLRFRSYQVDFRPQTGPSWTALAESSVPVLEDVMCRWNTMAVEDGAYELRLSVMDTLGLTGTAFAEVVVDNHAPWANETAPVMVSVTSGGNVYTTNGEVHLYFPPHAFARETQVDIEALSDADVPDTLRNGASRVVCGYEISWSEIALGKPATLEMSYGSPANAGPQVPPFEGTVALYVQGADSTWTHVGGTIDASAKRASAPITRPGRYAVFRETGSVSRAGGLSRLSITPRVFSPTGGFADTQAGISFSLGRSASVTVRLFSRSGRLIREIAAGEWMNAGANLVHWDGRDRNGNFVTDGLYLVTVEALGHAETKTLAVVN